MHKSSAAGTGSVIQGKEEIYSAHEPEELCGRSLILEVKLVMSVSLGKHTAFTGG